MKKTFGVCSKCGGKQIVYKKNNNLFCLFCLNTFYEKKKEKLNKFEYLFRRIYGKKPTSNELLCFLYSLFKNKNYYLNLYNNLFLDYKKRIREKEIEEEIKKLSTGSTLQKK